MVVSPQIEKGTAWIGDWKSIVFRRRGPVEMTMTDKGVYEQPASEPKLIDLHERNPLRARAEMRGVFQFLQPAALTKVDFAA